MALEKITENEEFYSNLSIVWWSIVQFVNFIYT